MLGEGRQHAQFRLEGGSPSSQAAGAGTNQGELHRGDGTWQQHPMGLKEQTFKHSVGYVVTRVCLNP